MSLAWKRFKLHVRGFVVATVAVATALMLFMNGDHRVSLWCFGLTDPARQINVIWIVLGTAAATLMVREVVRIAWRLRKDFRELQKLDEEAEARLQQGRRAAELDERERRLDQKLAVQAEKEVAPPAAAQGVDPPSEA